MYGLTKGALAQLTKSSALDYAPFGIRVNCVCPGTIETPLFREVIGKISVEQMKPIDAIVEGSAAAQPMKRNGQPSEVASVVAFLFSDNSSFMTGSLIPVDGGYTAQ